MGYQKNPGRNYSSGYDPMHSQSVLPPRPDPRRTRQLLRRNILGSKSHTGSVEPNESEGLEYKEQKGQWKPEEVIHESNYSEEVEPERKPRRKKKGVTRRKLLWGLGLAAVGGGTIIALEEGPKLLQTIEGAPADVEKQLQAAFEKGVQEGGDAVRKEFITALDSMEGVSLDAAIAAARLTRVAYDVFVSPLVTLAATVTGDFLTITLRAVQTARSWLARIYQDNDTLEALQTVLQTWVNDVNKMPKQIQTITDTDLDGAQAYLRAVQKKIQQEQALLNKEPSTPTSTKKK